MKDGGGKSGGYLAVGTQVVGNEEEFFPGNGETAAIGLNVLRMKGKRKRKRRETGLSVAGWTWTTPPSAGLRACRFLQTRILPTFR